MSGFAPRPACPLCNERAPLDPCDFCSQEVCSDCSTTTELYGGALACHACSGEVLPPVDARPESPLVGAGVAPHLKIVSSSRRGGADNDKSKSEPLDVGQKASRVKIHWHPTRGQISDLADLAAEVNEVGTHAYSAAQIAIELARDDANGDPTVLSDHEEWLLGIAEHMTAANKSSADTGKLLQRLASDWAHALEQANTDPGGVA